MKKSVFKSILAITVIILIISLSACGASSRPSSSFDDMNAGSSPEYDKMEVMPDYGYDDGYKEITSNSTVLAPDRKLIITNNTSIEALDFDATVELVRQRCAEFNGYIQTSELRGIETGSKYGTRYAYFSLRIPSDSFEAFMAGASDFGNILSSNTTGDDITEDYYDKEARLETLKIQEERYLALLEKAEDMDSIIVLEKALSDVRYQIESLTGTLKKYDSLVNYATINLRINEVYQYTDKTQEPALTLGDKLTQQLSDSWEALKSVGEFLLLAFVAMFPFLVAIAIIIVVIVVIIRLSLKKSKKSAKKQSENDEK